VVLTISHNNNYAELAAIELSARPRGAWSLASWLERQMANEGEDAEQNEELQVEAGGRRRAGRTKDLLSSIAGNCRTPSGRKGNLDGAVSQRG
jgi:hypothetical protein